MRPATIALTLATLAMPIAPAFAQATDAPVPVTVDDFVRAETDMYMATTVEEAGLGKLLHAREVTDVAHQTVIRMNRDTLYSYGVFDLDAGPVTITMPEAGDRFMSLLLINEDHYVVGVHYGAGSVTVSKESAETRYVFVAIRTLVNPNDPADVNEVHALQDQMSVSQSGTGAFEVPAWDKTSQDKIRTALLVLHDISGIASDAYGSKEEVDPIHHLIGTASGWGGNPARDAAYAFGAAPQNDGKTIYRMHVGEVPVDAFWSITVYNKEGYFEPNELNAYSINNLTATKSADGSINIQFGGCDGKVPNCLPITDGWNYAVRLYRPRAEILDGSWKFPEPQPVS